MSNTPSLPPVVPPEAQLFQIFSGPWVARCLTLAAERDIAGHIHAGKTNAGEISAAAGLHPGHLYRALRLLAAVGVFEELPHREFRLTPVGDLLRKDHPASMNAMLRMIGGGEHFNAWTKFEEAVATGGIATDLAEGMDIWSYYDKNPERAAIFNDAMTNFSRISDAAVAQAFPFGDFTCVCDFGGGHGGQIIAILRAYPNLRGFVFDQEKVVPGATANFAAAGLSELAYAVGGNFFESMEPGADVYISKNVIHDWDDEKSITILKNVRKVIPAHGRLLLAEITVAPPNIPDPGKFMDINMLAMTGGCERSAEEYAALFGASAFRLLEVRPTQSILKLVIAAPA
jgi:hypothetical protein